MPQHLLDHIRVGDAVQQLADRLAFFGVYTPASELLRDVGAHSEVNPQACTPLPAVSVLWGLEGTPPLASLLRPDVDVGVLRTTWDAATRALMLGGTKKSLARAVNSWPGDMARWARSVTGYYPYYLVNDPWCYHDGGIEFISPRSGKRVCARGEALTSFDGHRRSPVKDLVFVGDGAATSLPAVPSGSTLRALLEQALFVSDQHTLRLAHLCEVAGLTLPHLADLIDGCVPRPPQEVADTVLSVQPSRWHPKVQELLGLPPDTLVLQRGLRDQVTTSALHEPKAQPQEVCLAEVYRDLVEVRRVLTSGRFTAYFGHTVGMSEWLKDTPVPARTLRRWLNKFYS